MITLTPPTVGPATDHAGLLPLDCESCLLFRQCGGHQLEIVRAIGCGNYAGGTFDRQDMNPLDGQRYHRLWDDVYGLLDYSIERIEPIASADLPTYIPLLQHPYSRRELLKVPIVALHLYQVFRKGMDGRYRCRFKDGAELRVRYRLHPDTKILLSGVAIDRRLELFWAHHRKDDVATQLARLGIAGVTVPNFSFFTDVTRYQILRNRKRIVLMTERLSAAGVNVAPHLNAITPRDWEFWYELLCDHPDTSVVTLEFQTGLATQSDGEAALLQVAEIQQKLGRLIHPILVGGAKHFLIAQRLFSRYTVVDSRPFMEAQARRILIGNSSASFRWQKSQTERGASIDEHFRLNLTAYPEKLKLPVQTAEGAPFWDLRQMELFA
jgi:hypothetical protein